MLLSSMRRSRGNDHHCKSPIRKYFRRVSISIILSVSHVEKEQSLHRVDIWHQHILGHHFPQRKQRAWHQLWDRLYHNVRGKCLQSNIKLSSPDFLSYADYHSHLKSANISHLSAMSVIWHGVIKQEQQHTPATLRLTSAVILCVLCGELGHMYNDLLDLKLSPAQRHVDDKA